MQSHTSIPLNPSEGATHQTFFGSLITPFLPIVITVTMKCDMTDTQTEFICKTNLSLREGETNFFVIQEEAYNILFEGFKCSTYVIIS